MKVLVTGASGYLGGRICHALAKDGHSIRAFVRPTSIVDDLPTENVEIAYGDITDLDSLLKACSGCEVLFHSAALVEPWLPDPSKFTTVNVGGLKNVIEAVKHTSTLQKLIYTSSFFALGPSDGYIADERQMVERFNGRLPGYIGYGTDKASFSHVDDVAYGHVAAMHKGTIGERYLLTGENASFVDVFNLAANLTGTAPPRFHIPLWVIEMYGWLSVFWARITGKLPLISYPTVYVLKHQWAYSCVKAKTELGYDPRTLREGLAEVMNWLKSLGLIKY